MGCTWYDRALLDRRDKSFKGMENMHVCKALQMRMVRPRPFRNMYSVEMQSVEQYGRFPLALDSNPKMHS